MEYTNNRLKRLIKNAGFDQPEASIMDINYTSGRKLNKTLITRLATCEYISEHRNLFITDATDCGKTYMTCTFGMEACKQYFNTKYVRLPDLLIDLEIARTEGNYKKIMAKYANPLVLILDEWLLLKPNESEQRDIYSHISGTYNPWRLISFVLKSVFHIPGFPLYFIQFQDKNYLYIMYLMNLTSDCLLISFDM